MSVIKYIAIVILFFTLSNLYGQSVELEFPYFAGSKWHLWLFQGEKKDTIISGILDDAGKAKLFLPAKYKDYQGMSQWMLTEGGGVDIIFAGNEDFSISCIESQPDQGNIIYKMSRENSYLNDRFQQQQKILNKIEVLSLTVDVYKEDEESLPLFKKELQKQKESYTYLQEATAREALYAANFAQIVDVTHGLPKIWVESRKESEILINKFIVDELDFGVLYTSGHWDTVIDSWINCYMIQKQDEGMFIIDFKKILERSGKKEVQNAFIETVYKVLNDLNRKDLVEKIQYETDEIND